MTPAAPSVSNAWVASKRSLRMFAVAAWVLAVPGRVDGANGGSAAVPPLSLSGKHQLLLVRSAYWWSSTATLQRYERDASDATWKLVGAGVPVNLGRAGMGWGRGLHTSFGTGPQKREGDGRSPAGAFRLARAFGVAKELPARAAGFPYVQSSASSYCVEDTRSGYYNQLVDSTRVTPAAWERWSEMRRADGLFDWGIVVEQNAPDIKKGAGSCVFLHIWRGPQRSTSGCTSMAPSELEAVIAWLDPAREPLLVQLPEPVFRLVRSAWGLP